MHITDDIQHRFYLHLVVGDECWSWTGALSDQGYGQLKVHGKTEKAHRISYELHFGAPKMHVLHKCNNKICTRPDHLYDGTPSQNLHDRIKDGYRFSHRGLVDDDIRKIRAMAALGISKHDIAAEYNLSRSSVNSICNGQRWGRVK